VAFSELVLFLYVMDPLQRSSRGVLDVQLTRRRFDAQLQGFSRLLRPTQPPTLRATEMSSLPSVAYGLLRMTGAMVCRNAAQRVQMSVSGTMDDRIVGCGIISSCQSAATHCWGCKALLVAPSLTRASCETLTCTEHLCQRQQSH